MKPTYSFFKNTGYAIKGLRALLNESSFRIELFFLPFSVIFVCFFSETLFQAAIVFSSYLLVLFAEAVNSSIESVVDLVSPDYHKLAGQAKDMGSAAVFISIVIASILHISLFFLKIL